MGKDKEEEMKGGSEAVGIMKRLRAFVSRLTGRAVRREVERLRTKLAEGKARVEAVKRHAESLYYVSVPSLLDANPRTSALDGEVTGRACYRGGYPVVNAMFPKIAWTDDVDAAADFCFMWGYKVSNSNLGVVAAAARNGALLVTCEDGFLRSADTWANFSAPPRYRHGCSVIFDTLGFYYDATRPSQIEKMLNDRTLVVTEDERRRARQLIDKIVSCRLTKYNHQPIFTPEVGRPGRRKVLVVDQSYGDFAIQKGWGSDQTFAEMLEDAKRENPDADILVKTHPDTMTGTRAGYYDGVKEEGNVFRVTMPVNPYSLMDLVDKVYVCSTQLGFEALMAGKEVHVYGMPFYAGWGLTVDRQRNPRRTNVRSLEEVFHIFYLRYTHWMDIRSGRPCMIDVAIDNLLSLREEYRKVLADQGK